MGQRVKNLPAMRGHRFNPWVRKIPWRRAWQPTPVFLPGEPHQERNLAGYCPWGCKKLGTTEATENANKYGNEDIFLRS